MKIGYYFSNLFLGGMQMQLINLIDFCYSRHEIKYAVHSDNDADPILADRLSQIEQISLEELSRWSDVIHIDSYRVFNTTRKHLPVKKCIVTLPSYRRRKYFWGSLFFQQPQYVANSEYTASQIKFKAKTIRRGADVNIFKPKDSEKKKYDIVIIGRFHKIKNHQLFMDICLKGDFTFIAIGGTSKRASGHVNDIEKMMRMFAASRPGCRVESFVQPHVLSGLINQAKVAIVTSFNEGLGLNAIEPMACGLPVVGVDNGGTPEVVGCDEQCGYILPINSSLDAFVNKIKLCMDNKEMSINARNRVIQYFNLNEEMNAYEKLYTELGVAL